MPNARRSPRLVIDHREVSFRPGMSVLEVARAAGIDVPSLCWHEELSAHGGCRLCVVEIEGMPGFPLACTTRAEAGMRVLTETGALATLRREVLQLVLSRHPSSCFACDEREECALAQGTIRKAGVTTGCRFCPNDGQCELQRLVDRLGVTDLEYPITYPGETPEHDDPFFDRDLNLCVLCGRCVRVCQEVRCASVLSFVGRGPSTRVGPAFGSTHADAGCEFCGACVSVCPTGALVEKGSKWDGPPDREETSVCPFCAIGCAVSLHGKSGRLSWVDGHADPDVNAGQLCVRGRFCLPEATHHHSRMRRPHLRRDPWFRQVTWDAALDEAAERLRGVDPSRFLLVVSPDASNEAVWAAQRFAHDVMGSDGIDTSARRTLGGRPALWTSLLSHPVSVAGLGRSDAVLTVGFDRRFSLSVVTVRVRQARRRGARLVSVSAHDSALAREADRHLLVPPGAEIDVLDLLSRRLAGEHPADEVAYLADWGLDRTAWEDALARLGTGARRSVVIGPQAFAYDGAARIGEAVDRLCRAGFDDVVPIPFGANVRGALELGAFSELRPGDAPDDGSGPRLADLAAGGSVDALVLVGEVPFLERPGAGTVVAIDLYPPPFPVDAFLPAASFTEAGGTLTSLEGRVHEIRPIEREDDPRASDGPRPDWAILAELARRLGHRGFRWRDWRAVLREIRRQVPTFPSRPDRRPRPLAIRMAGRPEPPPGNGDGRERRGHAAPPDGGFLLVARPGGFRHRGIDLSAVVEGLGELAMEEGFRLHPADAGALGVATGDSLTVTVTGDHGATGTGPVRTDEDCPKGVIEYWRPSALGGLERRAAMAGLYAVETNPVGAQARAAGEDATCSG